RSPDTDGSGQSPTPPGWHGRRIGPTAPAWRVGDPWPRPLPGRSGSRAGSTSGGGTPWRNAPGRAPRDLTPVIVAEPRDPRPPRPHLTAGGRILLAIRPAIRQSRSGSPA